MRFRSPNVAPRDHTVAGLYVYLPPGRERGHVLDAVVALGLQPQTDVDGDGLERFEDSDGDGVVDRCLEADGTSFSGVDCMPAPRWPTATI